MGCALLGKGVVGPEVDRYAHRPVNQEISGVLAKLNDAIPWVAWPNPRESHFWQERVLAT